MVRLPRVNSLILCSTIVFLVVRSHPIVANLLSTGLYFLLELGLCESSVFRSLGVDPGPVGGFQALVGLLGPKGFLILGYPHNVSVAVFVVVIH